MNNSIFDVVLFEPEIPPNTGNVIRLCANIGCALHLVEPLGFTLHDQKLKRAGLDYHEYVSVIVHKNWEYCLKYLSGRRFIGVETSGETAYSDMKYQKNDVLVFGSETKGLPDYVLEHLKNNVVKIPMKSNQRSLNLSNSVAIVTYAAWQQLNFMEL